MIDLTDDRFAHHPELRDRIADPDTSFFRDFNVDDRAVEFPEMRIWTHSNEDREATRALALADHAGDLWVFAYGALMWDPALHFAEVRRARVAGFDRRFILMDVNGGRGTHEAPGLFAALDHGNDCDGLVFRIAAKDVDTETEILWRREMIAPGYKPEFVTATLDDGSVQALAFLADHAVDAIRPDLTRDEQVRYIAHGAGRLGTSHEYLANIVNHFATLDIKDAACADLLREVDDHLASVGPAPANEEKANQ